MFGSRYEGEELPECRVCGDWADDDGLCPACRDEEPAELTPASPPAGPVETPIVIID